MKELVMLCKITGGEETVVDILLVKQKNKLPDTIRGVVNKINRVDARQTIFLISRRLMNLKIFCPQKWKNKRGKV
jgi:hypothetical protein